MKSGKVKTAKLILAVVGGVLALAMIVITPMLAVAKEDELLKEELNNPTINAGCDYWQAVEVEDFGTVRLPADWVVSRQEDLLYITDPAGIPIAFGGVVGSRKEIPALAAAGQMAVQDSLETVPGTQFVSIAGAECQCFTAAQGMGLCLSLENRQTFPAGSVLCLIFTAQTEADAAAVLETAQAIAYFHHFAPDES